MGGAGESGEGRVYKTDRCDAHTICKEPGTHQRLITWQVETRDNLGTRVVNRYRWKIQGVINEEARAYLPSVLFS